MIKLYFGLKIFFEYIVPIGILLILGVVILLSGIKKKLKKRK
jgi:hypothetical protein